MKIKDFLENYDGICNIAIKDRFDYSEHNYRHKEEAIRNYGYFSIKNWTIDNNNIIIYIQSQF